MSYTVEIDFYINKHINLTEMNNLLRAKVEECNGIVWLKDMDCENESTKIQRIHSTTIAKFEGNDAYYNVLVFIKKMKKIKPFIVNSIYDELNHLLIYASKYYLSQQIVKNGKVKRIRSYSETDINMFKK
jgi:hypothetical protein